MAEIKNLSSSRDLKSSSLNLKPTRSMHKSPPPSKTSDSSFDVVILGGSLESFILNRELKARSFKTLLIPIESFPRLKSNDPIENPYQDFASSLNPESIYKTKLQDLNELDLKHIHLNQSKNNPKDFILKDLDLKNPNLKDIQPKKPKSKTISEIQFYFDELFKNIEIKENTPPFFTLNRILKLYLKKTTSPKEAKNSSQQKEVSSFEFNKGELSWIRLTSGEKISASWFIFCISPRLFVHWMKKSIKNKKDYPLSSRTFSKLAKFKSYSQVTLVYTHQIKKEDEKKEQYSTDRNTNETEKRKKEAKRSQGKGRTNLEIPENNQPLILNQGKKFCGGFFGRPYLGDHNQTLRKSYWMSLMPFEDSENRKLLREFVLSMKKQIFNHFPHLFKKVALKEEILLIEPESHGFLDFYLNSHFGWMKGAKNFLLSSSLFSNLPPPLNAFESATKTLDTLIFLISNPKNKQNTSN